MQLLKGLECFSDYLQFKHVHCGLMCYWAALLHVPVTGCRLRGSRDGLASSHLATLERCPFLAFLNRSIYRDPPTSKLSPLIHQSPAASEHTYCHTAGCFEDTHSLTHTPCINICICSLVESQSPTRTLNEPSQKHTVTLSKKPTALSCHLFTSVIKSY